MAGVPLSYWILMHGGQGPGLNDEWWKRPDQNPDGGAASSPVVLADPVGKSSSSSSGSRE